MRQWSEYTALSDQGDRGVTTVQNRVGTVTNKSAQFHIEWTVANLDKIDTSRLIIFTTVIKFRRLRAI